MKKLLMKVLVVATVLLGGISMTGCTDFERGLATGVVVGAGTTSAYHNGYRTNRRSSSSSLYRAGKRNGCSSARGRWYKNRYRWRTSASYRNGWRYGYRRCR